MNSKVIALAAAALISGVAFAQNSPSDPSEQRALQEARAAYSAGQNGDGASVADETRRPYSPFVFAFVPGLQYPFGRFDTSFCAAYIGALTYDINGFAAAGVFDMANNVHGFQASGVFNLAAEVDGFQAAGVFNMASSLEGFQGSGVFNLAGDAVSAFQGAGVFNVAKNISGVQVAGVFNVARRVEGAQIGLVNVADHIEGVQIGLINIAGNGVGGLTAVFEPDTDFLFTYWQTGTPWLYTVLGAGAPRQDWFSSSDRAVFSFGFGSRMERRGVYLDMDVSVEERVGELLDAGFGSGFSESTNPWTTPYPSARISIGIPVAGRIHLVGGFKIDVDLLDSPGLPAEFKAGRSFSDTWFGVPFSAYGTWFFGLRM